jgi:hypothetical protein
MSARDEVLPGDPKIPFWYHSKDLYEVRTKLDLAEDLAEEAKRNGPLTAEKIAAVVADLKEKRDALVKILDRLGVERAEYKPERDSD